MPRRRPASPTLADVARACGVGTMTVSRVVNGGDRVSAKTAARVRAVIKRLGYEPNEAARILKGHSARTIGFILPDLADPFFSICAHAVQQSAAKQGYMTLLLASERDSDREASALAMMNARSVAGILIVPTSPSSVSELQKLQARGIPVVMLDRIFPGLQAGEVMVENEKGAQMAVMHLLEHGHRSILCVAYDSQFNSITQRMSGYKKTMTQAGLKPEFVLVDEVSTVSAKVLERLRAANPPTALFTLNNVATMQVLQALQQERIDVPQDIAIIGFDDFELAPLLAVPITTVRQPAAQLGQSATHLLLDWIRRPRGSDARSLQAQVILPTELIIRRSCGCQSVPRIEQEQISGIAARE
jgi:LacI family transcriptional regulator